MVILRYALVHPRVLERQAAEPHFLPVKLEKNARESESFSLFLFVRSSFQII